MKIFIYSPQREISYIIADTLSCNGNHCIAFERADDLSSLLRNMIKGPDLLILDYLSFNHDLFDINKYFKCLNKKIPVIFFNDPCLTRSSRSLHWKALLELLHPDFQSQEIQKYYEIFIELEDLVESTELSPYIALMQPHKALPEEMIKDKYTLQYIKDSSNDCILSFKERNKLPNNLYYLLSLLQKNKATPLGLNQIIDIYNTDGKSISDKSLRVLISKLKKLIREDKNCGFLIHQDNGSYRFVRYKY